MSIIKFAGKPLEKLVEVISQGVGTIYKPMAIRREAKARAFEIETIERAKAKALAEGREIEAESYLEIQRLINRENRREQNIDNVAQETAKLLSQESNVSEEPVDDDWAIRFFNIVEDVTNEEMQTIWARILAEEIKKPKSFSLRTLEVLRNLSADDARCFMKFANFAIGSDNMSFMINITEENDLLEKYKLTFEDRLLLTELDLLIPTNLMLGIGPDNTNQNKSEFVMGNILLEVECEDNFGPEGISILRFTKIGKELLQLIQPVPELDYIKLFASKFRNRCKSIKYAKTLEEVDGKMQKTELVDVPL